MDPATTALIASQAVTFVLLLVSELLPFTPGPVQGILQAILTALEQRQQNSSTN